MNVAAHTRQIPDFKKIAKKKHLDSIHSFNDDKDFSHISDQVGLATENAGNCVGTPIHDGMTEEIPP